MFLGLISWQSVPHARLAAKPCLSLCLGRRGCHTGMDVQAAGARWRSMNEQDAGTGVSIGLDLEPDALACPVRPPPS